MVKWDDDIFNTPTYPVTDAARYLHIPVGTLRSWLHGRSYTTKNGKQSFSPLIQLPSSDLPQLSFTNLVEAHVLRVIRESYEVKLDKVRTALDYMSQALDTNHPLVMKRFQTDGVDLFIDQMDKLVNVSRAGQFGMREALKNLLTRIEWDANGLANRLFPTTGNDKIIFLDPSIRFGKPVIASKGVPTDIIAELYNAGDSIEDIADEYDCTILQVTTAIHFESRNRAA
jgi:uncharacterized protein (DUF433 family)